MPLNSKHTEASLSPTSTDSLYLRIAQVPRSTLPLAHACRVMIHAYVCILTIIMFDRFDLGLTLQAKVDLIPQSQDPKLVSTSSRRQSSRSVGSGTYQYSLLIEEPNEERYSSFNCTMHN